MEENIMEELTPQQYFDAVKEQKHLITDEELQKVYDNCLELLNGYVITGQTKAARKLCFHLECIEKEREIVKMGINTFVYRDDIEYYIDSVAKDTVKIMELSNYEREVPEDVKALIACVKDKFDQLYIVFTDYTGKVERQVEKERRDKDPILFGTFQDQKSRTLIDRFYYLADWEDKYCDLTLDKMVNETAEVGKRNIVKTISTPSDIKELKEQLESLDGNTNGRIPYIISNQEPKKPSFFQNVMTFFSRKRK
jgi:hypothetical protein